MKVLFVASLYYPYVGGAERILRIIAEGLVKAGHQPVVVCLSKERCCIRRDVNGVKVYYLRLRNLYWPFDGYRPSAAVRAMWATIDAYNIYASRAVGRILDLEQPSLVNTHNLAGFSGSVWSEVKRRDLPLVHTILDYWLICGKSTMYTGAKVCRTPCLACRILSAPRRHLSRMVDAVIADGDFLLQMHLEQGLFGDGRPTRRIYNASGVELGIRPPAVASAGRLRLGYLGRVEPSKGVEALLETLAAIPEGWELQIAGSGLQAYEERLKERFQSDRLKFLGFVEPKELFVNIDVLVVPSVWNDPLPTVIFEAYAHGVPVIGSSRGGIPEVIEDGKTGLIFSHEVRGSLESAIRQFMGDPELAARMRPNVLAKARQRTQEHVVEEYLALYTQLLKSN
jgi:glycosyltransferase involved in cell wall biosynthesis